MRSRVLVYAATAFSFSAGAVDCRKLTSKTDRLVCKTPALVALDQQLNLVYAAAFNDADAPEKVQSEQLAWIKSVASCVIAECVDAKYRARLEELKPRPAEPLPPVGQTARLTFHYQSKNSLTKKQTAHFKFPVFSGQDKARAEELNHFVTTHWSLRETCGGAGDESTNVTVERIGEKAVAFSSASEVECKGASRAEALDESVIYVNGAAFSGGRGLSAAARGDLYKRVWNETRSQVKSDADSECFDKIAGVSNGGDLDLGFNGGSFNAQLKLPRVDAGCAKSVLIPKDEFLRKYIEPGALRDSLSTL